MILIVVGIVLIAVGLVFVVRGMASDAAGVQAFKINVQGASWLVLVLAGVAMVGAGWWFDTEHTNTAKPAADEVVVTVEPAAEFEESHEAEPYTFGDDEHLDALSFECEAGQMQSCDDLYQESPVGSEYELYGATCGYRFEQPPEFCIDAPIAEP